MISVFIEGEHVAIWDATPWGTSSSAIFILEQIFNAGATDTLRNQQTAQSGTWNGAPSIKVAAYEVPSGVPIQLLGTKGAMTVMFHQSTRYRFEKKSW